MKLSNFAMKLTCMKGKAVRVLAAAALAGVVLIASPAAKAQRFAIGVQFGGPRYVAPAPVAVAPAYGYGYGYPAYGYSGYGYPGYWDHRRYEDFRAHENFVRREDAYRFHHEAPYRGYRR